MTGPQVFVSYSGQDAFEAALLQFAIETLLRDQNVVAWTYQRDQATSEREISQSIKQRVRDSCATVFLVSPTTMAGGKTQWMELAYADAFDVQTFVLLHHLKYSELKAAESGAPPLLLAGQCNDATQWRTVIGDIGKLVEKAR